MIEIVPAEIGHILSISHRLRERERLVSASTLVPAWSQSYLAEAALVDGEVAVIWGITGGFFAERYEIWLIGSDLIARHPIAFLRHSRRIIDSIADGITELYGWVWADWPESIAWLEWLGFEVEREATEGILCFRGTLPLRTTQRRGFGVR